MIPYAREISVSHLNIRKLGTERNPTFLILLTLLGVTMVYRYDARFNGSTCELSGQTILAGDVFNGSTCELSGQTILAGECKVP